MEIVGTAMPQLTDYAITPITRGDRAYNLFNCRPQARLTAPLVSSRTTKTHPDILLADMAEKAKIEKIRRSPSSTVSVAGRSRNPAGHHGRA